MLTSRRQILKLAAGTALIAGMPAAARAGPVRFETGAAFGSTWRLVMAESADASIARKRVETIVERIDQLMSPFRPDSEVTRFNISGGRGAVLSDETRKVVASTLDLARISGGAFDPTAAPIGRRFGFGSIRIGASRPAGHYKDLRLAGNKLQTLRAGLTIDLCAAAKGYALDEIVVALDGLDFLIELGGEIAARGVHPSGRPWRLGIERPGTNILQRTIEADERSLATSGDAVQGYTVGGQRYGHVVDPRTGEPVASGVSSVSVLASTGMLADGLATAALVLGPQHSLDLLAAYDASAFFLVQHDGKLAEVEVRGFLRSQST
jgi:thiamine biosynthesis lipoprotein